MRRSEAPLLLEHLAQSGEAQGERARADRAEPADQPPLVEGAQLIENDQPFLAAKPEPDAGGGICLCEPNARTCDRSIFVS